MTTDIVVTLKPFEKEVPTVLVSFARSGNCQKVSQPCSWPKAQ